MSKGSRLIKKEFENNKRCNYTPCPTESVSENFPPRIPRWTGKISARILGENFPSEDSSLDEKKATEEGVLVKFFVVHVSKNCCLESTED